MENAMITKEEILKDIHNTIRIAGIDEIDYELPKPRGHEVIVRVIRHDDERREIEIERIDELGAVLVSNTNDFNCNDETLLSMIEGALNAETDDED